MKTPTITECSNALQAMMGTEAATRRLVSGTRWENDPRVLAFWAQAEALVGVIREAHRAAAASDDSEH